MDGFTTQTVTNFRDRVNVFLTQAEQRPMTDDEVRIYGALSSYPFATACAVINGRAALRHCVAETAPAGVRWPDHDDGDNGGEV